MEIRVLIGFFLSYTVCLWTQNSLCDEPRVYNNDSLIRAKRVILNYLDLDERAFRLNQNIDQLDGEFLCALEVIKKNGADPELQLRLIHFIPKPWNTKDWLLKAYTGIAALVRKEVLEGRINNLRGQKNSVFPRFLKLIEKIKVARLSESEIDYLAAILREFPYFVVSDFLKRLASKSSKAFQNVLFLIASLERNNYFLNKHRVIQIYQSIHGTCEKVPDISPWVFLSCKNKVPKEKITVEADYFFSIFQNVVDEDALRLAKTFKFNDPVLDWLMAKLLNLDLKSRKLFEAFSRFVLPPNLVNLLAKRNQFHDLYFDVENYLGLSSEEKITFLTNVSQFPLSESFLLAALKSENDLSVCMSAVTLFNRMLIPIQGKLSSSCARVFEDVTFCPSKFSVLKLDELTPAVFVLNEKCLRGLRGGHIKYPQIMELFFASPDFLHKLQAYDFKLESLNPKKFYRYTLEKHTLNEDFVSMWDEDYQNYFVIQAGMPLEALKTQKGFKKMLFFGADEKFLDYGLLILETFGFEKIISRFEELFLASESPDESLRLASVFASVFCSSKNKNEIAQRLYTLKTQVQNIRQYVQIEALIYHLTERDDTLRFLSITPFEDDILSVLRVGCLKDLF